jgi:hypothetical protein
MRIFLSYRRTDTGPAAARLADRLRARSGPDDVVADVADVAADIAAIEGGTDLRIATSRAVGECDVLLALIGPGWLDPGAGWYGIGEPADLVAAEIAAGLDQGIRVVPVLVDGAVLPRIDQLPLPLARLASQQAARVAPDTFDADADRLAAALRGRPRRSRRSRNVLFGATLGFAVAVVAAAVVVFVTVVQPFDRGPVADPTSRPLPAAVASAAPPPATTTCAFATGSPGVIGLAVTSAGRASGLTFCPVRINDGKLPVTGPFEVAGQVLGDPGRRGSVVLWNQQTAGTCDADGRPPAVRGAKFVADGADLASPDGSWSYRAELGYDGAVTYGRQFELVTASPTNLAKIVEDAPAWGAQAGRNPADYPGIAPGDVPPHTVLASFTVPPGTYRDAKPCAG